MKNLASALLAGIGVAAIFQWWEIVYRFHLFIGEYHAVPGVNHIGDGDFGLIYLADALLLVAGLFTLRVVWRSRAWRTAAMAVSAANLCGWLAFFVMHGTGVLVEYREFLRYSRGGI